MSDVLVTGATGLAGRHLVWDLQSSGLDVRVTTRSPERAHALFGDSVEVVAGDLAEPAVASRAVSGVRVVYHLAAAFTIAGIPNRRYWLTNVESTRHLLQRAREEDIERFVHCSTIGVHSHVEHPPADETAPYRPGDVYQSTKAEAEQLALAFGRSEGLPVTVVRPTSIYGPGDLRLLKLFRMIDRGRFVMLGDGEVCFHLVYVTDLVAGFRLAASSPRAVGEVFIVGGAEALPLRELVRRIAEALDVPAPRWRLPLAPVYALSAVVEKICVALRVEPPLYRRRVALFRKNRDFSIAKARALLGYEPRVDLDSGLRRTIAWYREQRLLPPVRSSEPPAGRLRPAGPSGDR